ncbi:S1/P1 nuclease [Porifericola rhodea]|uniref:S1/P1 nuclease n=1 Tax=Porifericola rhodea TaxID=930972 RepID=UPI002665D8D6|nr:S1/P1 nuclease [Porifericola rhodea]WKN33527.1 S1/P1 nuclease [Porifericola rhodea]
MYKVTTLLIAFFVQLVYTPLFGWGQIGHRAVGQIAEWHLSKKATKNISQVLGPLSLAMVSTWMDEIRSDDAYDYTNTWHWVTIPDNTSYNADIQEEAGDAFGMTQKIIAALKTDTLSQQEEKEYLMMLVHLVGDLHQPLHVGNGEDRGGNDVKVEWMGEPSNLHRVWDSDMIDGKQLSYTELAQHLNRRATERLVQQWQSSSPEQWLAEAMELRPQVYDVPDNKRLGYQYSYQNYATVEHQLLVAGVRLAGILNEIYG